MRKIFILSSIFFMQFLNLSESFALQEVFKPNHKNKKGEFAFYGRIFADNIMSDEYSSTNNSDEYKTAETRFDIISRTVYDENWSLYFNYRIQENPFQASAIAARNSGLETGNKYYDNHFGLTRELYLAYENDDFHVYGGKFRPAFGHAWLLGRGIWTQELSLDYMQLEKIGLGGALKAGDNKKVGGYKFGFAAYKHDTKYLDGTQFTTRDGFNQTQNLAGNDRFFGSYTAYIDIDFDFGEKFGQKETLFYRFAYTNLAVDANRALQSLNFRKIDDEKGVAATMKYRNPISQNFALDSLLEFADIKNVNGDTDVSNQYFNSSFIVHFYHNWNLTYGFAKKRNITQDENGFDQYFNEISTGYTFDKTRFFDRLQLQFGYKNLRTNFKNDLEKRNIYALMLRYVKSF